MTGGLVAVAMFGVLLLVSVVLLCKQRPSETGEEPTLRKLLGLCIVLASTATDIYYVLNLREMFGQSFTATTQVRRGAARCARWRHAQRARQYVQFGFTGLAVGFDIIALSK